MSVFSPRAPLREHFKDSQTEFLPLLERSASENFTVCVCLCTTENLLKVLLLDPSLDRLYINAPLCEVQDEIKRKTKTAVKSLHSVGSATPAKVNSGRGG